MIEVKAMLRALMDAIEELRREIATVRAEIERVEALVKGGGAGGADQDR